MFCWDESFTEFTRWDEPGWKGLSAAGRAQKELGENEVAEGGMGWGDGYSLPPSPLSLLSSFFLLSLRPILD